MPRSRRRLITIDEAKPAATQHKSPCGDCPWARRALPGWLGGQTTTFWLELVTSDELIQCHTLAGAQCAGAAIYRTHISKMPRTRKVLLLPKNPTWVFSSHAEFIAHHKERSPADADAAGE